MWKETWVQNDACNRIVSRIDTGSLNPSGRIYLYRSDSSVITYLPYSLPAYRDATDGTAVANPITDNVAFMDATGDKTAAYFSAVNRDNSVCWSGTVSRYDGLGDLKLNSVIIFKDSTISLAEASYIVPK